MYDCTVNIDYREPNPKRRKKENINRVSDNPHNRLGLAAVSVMTRLSFCFQTTWVQISFLAPLYKHLWTPHPHSSSRRSLLWKICLSRLQMSFAGVPSIGWLRGAPILATEMAKAVHASLPSQQGIGLQAPLASYFQDPQHLAVVADPSLLHDSVQHYFPVNKSIIRSGTSINQFQL